MSSLETKLSLIVGVGASVAVHVGVAAWLAFAPPTLGSSRGEARDWSGIDLALVPPATDPTAKPPEPTKQSPAPTPKPPEPEKQPELPKPEPLPPEPTPVSPPPEPPPVEPPPVEMPDLGIDDSAAPKTTKAFVGHPEATEHRAPSASVEQEALNPKPGVPGRPQPPSDAPPTPLPTDPDQAKPAPPALDTTPAPEVPTPETPAPAEATPTPAEAAPQPPTPAERPSDATSADREPTPPTLLPPSPPAALPGQPGPESPAAGEPTPGTGPEEVKGDDRVRADPAEESIFGQIPLVIPGLGPVMIKLRLPAPGGQPAPSAVPAAAPAPEPSPAPAATAAKPNSAPAGSDRSRPGELSPKESSAFTIKQTQEYRPGRVLAPEGIDVTTVDPQISMLSSMTGSLRNPLIELRFGPDGKVKSATFKDGLSSGRTDWDEPIMHAMHRWTIGGKKFKQMLRDNPSREVVMTVRLLLTR